ncbi:hypothetical protein FGO68_gene12194 [Halteria grandinella]|uniref:Uncharacterized protein n=1 Tax=Halteria grandinella TaxID=5974 RepID=A0A8J8SUC7_HALGN|nr:hypothetical protein FGO68_gene12194 [Halteria grandinella]
MFGSLQKQADVWSSIHNASSLNWSRSIDPSSYVSRFVTCSEDQTCKVWSFTPGFNPQHVSTLKGHTLAVTSVDWKRMKDGREYFVSCSDDDYVRVYDPSGDKFELLFTLDTKFIKEWHTLTYMALEEGGEHLVCVSENGYLFVWNLMERRLLYSRKIHGGSIEALAWRDKTIVCCSSDCTFSVITVDYEALEAEAKI